MRKFRKICATLLVACVSTTLLAGCSKLVSLITHDEEISEVSEEPSEEVSDGFDMGAIGVNSEETSEEPSEEPSSASSISQSSGEQLGDSVFEYAIEVNGQVLKFPMMTQDLLNLGWECKDDLNQMVPSGNYGLVYFQNGNNKFVFYVINMSVNEAAVSDCIVGGLTVDQYSLKEGDVFLPGGIQLMTSTRDDVLAAYGNPEDSYDSDKYPYDNYSEDFYQNVKCTYRHEEGDVLYEIQIRNFVEPKGYDHGEVDTTTVPEITQKYTAPTELSDNLFDYTVEFAGDYYVLPAPVSEFIKNGWTINTNESEAAIEGSGSGKLTLSKGDQEFWTYVRNYDTNATLIENCFVTELEASEYGPDVTMKVSQGIEMGGAESVIEALTGYTIDKKETDLYIQYTIKDDRALTFYYEIICKKGKITQIKMQYQPKVRDYRASKGL